jgi:esterase/lipase
MNLKAYRASGAIINAVLKLCRVELRVTGAEHLVDRPTLFAVNHFTRMETLLVPHVIYREVRRPVHSLATHTLFKGLVGKYLDAVGVTSVRDPRRNRKMIRSLMTGDRDWVIYPEGGLIKNKKTLHRGRLHLTHPGRQGPPHTGAAVVALKAEMAKRRLRAAYDAGDANRTAYYRHAYDITSREELSEVGTVIVPLNVTFYPLRPRGNALSRLMRVAKRNLDPRVVEELHVEGGILLGDSEISIHFGEPIEVSDYLDRTTELARRVVGVFSEDKRSNLMLRRQATRLTTEMMHRIYGHTEVNLDHLFCYGLRALKADRVPVEDFHRALFLAAARLRELGLVRVHPTLEDGIAAMLKHRSYKPLESVATLAIEQHIIQRDNGHYVINREILDEPHDFHEVRLKKIIQVIANELEPVRGAVDLVRKLVNMPPERLRQQTADTVRRLEQEDFLTEHGRSRIPGASKPVAMGEPFWLPAKDRGVGVVLVHGYLASPAQMRPLADHLHAHGCSVYGVRLPGHGTVPEHLTEVNWLQWLDAVLKGIHVVENHCDRVVVGGLSLGGVLALLAAARLEIDLDGVVCINPPMKLRDRRAPLVHAIVVANAVLRKLRMTRGHTARDNRDSESPDTNYTRDYMRGIRELRRSVAVCRRCLAEVTAPTLVIQATDDPVVDPDATSRLMARLGSDEKRFADHTSARHIIVRGPGQEAVFEEIARFIDEVCPRETPKGRRAPATAPVRPVPAPPAPLP